MCCLPNSLLAHKFFSLLIIYFRSHLHLFFLAVNFYHFRRRHSRFRFLISFWTFSNDSYRNHLTHFKIISNRLNFFRFNLKKTENSRLDFAAETFYQYTYANLVRLRAFSSNFWCMVNRFAAQLFCICQRDVQKIYELITNFKLSAQRTLVNNEMETVSSYIFMVCFVYLLWIRRSFPTFSHLPSRKMFRIDWSYKVHVSLYSQSNELNKYTHTHRNYEREKFLSVCQNV